MLKLYALYILLGIYVFWEQLLAWIFNPVPVIPALTFYSSIILFSVAPIIVLFKAKFGSLVRLLCLIGVAPFAGYWLFYDNDFVIGESFVFHLALGIAILLYVVAIFYSTKTLVDRKTVTINNLKKPIKLGLAAIPIMLFLFYIGLEIFDK